MDTTYAVVLFIVHIIVPKVLKNVNKVKRKESVLESHSQYSYAFENRKLARLRMIIFLNVKESVEICSCLESEHEEKER